jgi:hypothetical protein
MTKMLFAFATIGIVAFSLPGATNGFAGEPSIGREPMQFHAISTLPDGRHVDLAAMTDDQLAEIEGAAFYCRLCIDAAWIREVKARVRALRLHRRAARIRQLISAQLQDLPHEAARIRQVNVKVRSDSSHQSNTATVRQSK